VIWTVSARMAPQSVTCRFAISGGEKLTEEQEAQGRPAVERVGSVVMLLLSIIHSPRYIGAPELNWRLRNFMGFLF
jgi:hypothetical protein